MRSRGGRGVVAQSQSVWAGVVVCGVRSIQEEEPWSRPPSGPRDMLEAGGRCRFGHAGPSSRIQQGGLRTARSCTCFVVLCSSLFHKLVLSSLIQILLLGRLSGLLDRASFLDLGDTPVLSHRNPCNRLLVLGPSKRSLPERCWWETRPHPKLTGPQNLSSSPSLTAP